MEIDYHGTGARAAGVAMTSCQTHREDAGRRSSRTGQAHSIGGFVGTAEYEGDLAEFLPWLTAAQWVGVGRHAVWGKGEVRVSQVWPW
jgi:CRISPR/Cas system endoribonuclease Cas6 (RAMP superfamily)